MTITIDLPIEVEEKIKTQASDDGLKVEEYIKSLIEEATENRERMKKISRRSFDEILAPVHTEFEESGMGEDELDEFLNDVREKLWQEKPVKGKK